jgi:primosomal protein N''
MTAFFLAGRLRAVLRYVLCVLGSGGAFRAVGDAIYRWTAERYVASLRRRPAVLEAWILGSGADGERYHPGASDLDFLLVVERGTDVAPLLREFRRHFFLYPPGTTVEHLAIFSEDEWAVFRPLFDDPRTGRGKPLLIRGARVAEDGKPASRPVVSDALASRDVYYRLVGALSALQPTVHRWETATRLERVLFLRAAGRIESSFRRLEALSDRFRRSPADEPSNARAWLADVLLALARWESTAAVRAGDGAAVPETATVVPTRAPRSEWGARHGAALSRFRNIDHWLVASIERSEVRALLEEYVGTDRRVYVHSGPGFDRFHGNYPPRPTIFWDFSEGAWKTRPRRFDRDRAHIEALRHYGRYRLAGIPEASDTLRQLARGAGGSGGGSLVPVTAFALPESSAWRRSMSGTSVGPGHSPAPGVSA